MSVAPKMLTERQQLAIALRESMTAAPARVATPGSAPRPAAHSPAGDEVRAPDTSAAPPGGGCPSHFQNAVARGSFLGTREHPSSSRRASDSRVRRRVDDDHAPCRAASPSVASGARIPSRKPSVASQPPCSRADRSPIRAHPDDRHSCAAYAASRKQKKNAQAEPHKRARKLSRVERELASLAPWAWDPLVGKHAPGNAMMRDFAEVAADKVVTTNTDTYDSYRFAAPAEPTAFPSADPRRARFGDRRGDASMTSNADSDPRKGKEKRGAVGRSPLAKTEKEKATATPATATPAPATARKATPAAVSKKRAAAVEDATPPSSTRDVAFSKAKPSREKLAVSKKRASNATATTKETRVGDEASTPAFGKKKTKPRSSLSVGNKKSAPRVAVGKNLVDALERAVEGTGVAETETSDEGKENAPPRVGANGAGPGSVPGPGPGPVPVPGPAARAPRSARAPRAPPLADLGESRRHREAALLAVAAAEADAEAASSGPAMTPSQQLLQAYYDLTGSWTLPSAARLKRRDAAAERFTAEPEPAPPHAENVAPFSSSSFATRFAPPFANPPRPVCVTVGPFPGFSFESYERLPSRVVPLTASVARACDYLEKRDAAEARRGET